MERVRVPEKLDIHLTDAESEICTLLDGCTQWMKDERGMETSCRIAGGWVRDKVNAEVPQWCPYVLLQ
jgi:tRNA nucleotidyltransferase (CCA-adding enzyme)